MFVGPPPDAIAAMGDKAEAKRRARERGVPVVPGYDGDDQSPETLAREARRSGTRSSSRRARAAAAAGCASSHDLAAFDEALEAAKREALGAFGDDRVLLESYIARPRHIEFQILADAHGTTLHFGERECSIQRRHQKIVEEAPSVALSPDLRARMGEAAIRAARAVGYVNAGTVEFLLDESGAFYFLEMNARLQVEHPVTELVYGVDLVRLQLAIAGGEPLALRQEDVTPRGWAIEARITAEDPERGYLPATGTITRWDPSLGPGLRLDAGVRAGSEVSIYYDSMLAKLIAYGSDRAAAVARLAAALADFRVEGVPTDIPLLLKIVRDPDFRAGETTTAYLVDHADFMQPETAEEPDEAFLLATAAVLNSPRAWRVAQVGIPINLLGKRRRVGVVASPVGHDGAWRLEGDLAVEFHFKADRNRVGVRTADGRRYSGQAALNGDSVDVAFDGATFRLELAAPPSLEALSHARGGGPAGAVTSPMPGKIVKVAVKVGDEVVERDLLVVLEAMKMEHRIEASRNGTVKSVAVAPGALVTGGATLLEIE